MTSNTNLKQAVHVFSKSIADNTYRKRESSKLSDNYTGTII